MLTVEERAFRHPVLRFNPTATHKYGVIPDHWLNEEKPTLGQSVLVLGPDGLSEGTLVQDRQQRPCVRTWYGVHLLTYDQWSVCGRKAWCWICVGLIPTPDNSIRTTYIAKTTKHTQPTRYVPKEDARLFYFSE